MRSFGASLRDVLNDRELKLEWVMVAFLVLELHF